MSRHVVYVRPAAQGLEPVIRLHAAVASNLNNMMILDWHVQKVDYIHLR